MAARTLVWITGSGGFIGHHLILAAPVYAPQCQTIGLTHAQLDLTDFEKVREQFKRDRPDLVLHCAAQADTSICQANPTQAHKINVEATANLAELAQEIPLFFFSSDLVFDGRLGDYHESSPVSPLGVYAETKAQAEHLVLANPKHTVIRTSLNGGTSLQGDHAFNEKLRRAWQAGRAISLFTDEFRSPIPVAVTAQAVWELVQLQRPGLFHLAGSERLSRWQIGQLLAARSPALRPQIVAASLADYHGPARAPDTSLNCSKLQQLLSFRLPGLSAWLSAHPQEMF